MHHCMMLISLANPKKCIVVKQRFIGHFRSVFGSFTYYDPIWINFCFDFFEFGSFRELLDLAISSPFLHWFSISSLLYVVCICCFGFLCVLSSCWSEFSVFVGGQNIAKCKSSSCFMDRLVSWQTRCFRVTFFLLLLSSPSSFFSSSFSFVDFSSFSFPPMIGTKVFF